MAAKPLTATEKAWLKKLQAVFDECPSDRLGAYTVGDPWLGIYDRSMEQEINKHLDNNTCEFGNSVDALGAGFMTINTPFSVLSTAG
jgi:hypothetical protein